ncbi:hypothetical protein [Chryseobacterium sp. ON_d1]|nr:hypothetical protein [Chryseobacterium sp. ON_d1]GEJ43564.1 hypothetical protein CRS_01720 [Chryseobacterium sp. ON_d1]
MERTEPGKLTPEKVVKILEKKGTIVTIEEAETLLNFIKIIAILQ